MTVCRRELIALILQWRKSKVSDVVRTGLLATLCYAQPPLAILPVSPQCSFASQSPASDPLEPASVTYLHDPQPYEFPGMDLFNKVSLTSEFTARIVSSRPLVVDVVRNSGSKAEVLNSVCGLTAFPWADDKLKDALSTLRFGEEVKVTATYNGMSDDIHELVLKAVAPTDSPLTHDTCENPAGLLLSYRDLVEYVVVYRDGP